ncbi:hypothetical protein [Nocardia jiangxiensis]|uniref:Uncharacterized protein n=1 Tax=Nocardia jiangxiensis TaxID=282685 RepID=A0ABW6RSC6_9NOCA|nr:hypothetical protein [Nocardia jiangxiensis]
MSTIAVIGATGRGPTTLYSDTTAAIITVLPPRAVCSSSPQPD